MIIFEVLGLDPLVFLFHLINLAIIIVLGWLLLRKPMSRMMHKQNQEVAKVVDENKKLIAEAEDGKHKRALMEAEIKEEALRITGDAAKAAAAKADEILEKAQIQAKGIIDTARKEAVAERERYKDDYRRTITDVSLEIAEKILAREFSQKDNQKVIDDCLKELLS